MRWTFLSVPLLAVLSTGCDELDTKSATLPEKAPPVATSPDNSGVNERDRSGNAKTPLDQGQSKEDVERTAEIRRKILAIKDVSINAQNAKVITESGKVTLRGPVASEEEKESLFKAAVEVAGEANVVNELEVVPVKP